MRDHVCGDRYHKDGEHTHDCDESKHCYWHDYGERVPTVGVIMIRVNVNTGEYAHYYGEHRCACDHAHDYAAQLHNAGSIALYHWFGAHGHMRVVTVEHSYYYGQHVH